VKPDTLRYLTRAALLAAVYALFAKLGLSVQPVNAFATLVWPPTGIALAALLILGNSFWPAIACGAFVANVWTGAPPLVALGIGAGNTLEALLGAYALSRIPGFRRSLDRLQDVLGLIFLAGVMSTAASASIGVASLLLGGVITPGHIGATWRAWWLGDVIGDLVVAPLILTWKLAEDAQVPRGRIAERAVLGALLVAASLFIFDHEPGHAFTAVAPARLGVHPFRRARRGEGDLRRVGDRRLGHGSRARPLRERRDSSPCKPS
jgi:two-component system, NarL family, sensor histidine kinase FusK